MEKLRHYIVTRFNLGLYRTNPNPDKWFYDRMKIFEAVTLPSLQKQTCQNFHYAVLVDAETPNNHMDVIDGYFLNNHFADFTVDVYPISLSNDWHPKRYGERWSCAIEYRSFTSYISAESKRVIQTRLDNDDALMPDAIKRIQDQIAGPCAMCIDFTRGYVVDSVNKKLYHAKHPYGTPFISLHQSCSSKMKCIYDYTHQKFPKLFPQVEVADRIWIMNLHERNVSNRLFPWLIEEEIPYDRSIPGCI